MMKLGSVSFTITLSTPATGATIGEAVGAVAKKNGKELVHEMETLSVTDGVRIEGHMVGQFSKYPYEDLRVEVLDGDSWKDLLDLKKSYSQLRVVNWRFAGMKYLVGYNDEAVIVSVEKFRDELAVQLST